MRSCSKAAPRARRQCCGFNQRGPRRELGRRSAGQAVSNLVGNAIQHGDGTPVTLTAEEEATRYSRCP